jgi:hypothetical protein
MTVYDGDWNTNPRHGSCPWCRAPEEEYEPFDNIEAESELCRGHLAEYLGTSLDGLDRMESEMRKDREL